MRIRRATPTWTNETFVIYYVQCAFHIRGHEKPDLARIRVIAQARMQFKQLSHVLAVNTSTRNSGLTNEEMTD
jgi:hypothetical protein